MMNAPATTGDDLRELYRELILDHARSPRHFGKLGEATHQAEGINPLCGDKLKVYLQIANDNRIADIAFEGSGCAISVASASLLTETVVGKSTDEAMAFAASIVRSLTQDGEDATDLGKLVALRGVREFPSRVKCATLAWHALDAAINGDPEPATTE